MRRAVPAVLAVVFIAAQAVTSSQSPARPRSATDVTNADIRAVIARAPPDGILDQQIRIVDMGKYNVAVGVLHRSAKPAQQGAIDHAQVTEVYHIIDGSGTFVTGGTIANARQVPADNVINTILVGPSTTGAAIQGGQSRKVGPGDVIIVPPGVAHWFSSVDADMNYLVIRVDGDHILPAGYVNPALKKQGAVARGFQPSVSRFAAR
jgi:mannose-6-phosphate isomerase-like protein (cupin superfamily)